MNNKIILNPNKPKQQIRILSIGRLRVRSNSYVSNGIRAKQPRKKQTIVRHKMSIESETD